MNSTEKNNKDLDIDDKQGFNISSTVLKISNTLQEKLEGLNLNKESLSNFMSNQANNIKKSIDENYLTNLNNNNIDGNNNNKLINKMKPTINTNINSLNESISSKIENMNSRTSLIDNTFDKLSSNIKSISSKVSGKINSAMTDLELSNIAIKSMENKDNKIDPVNFESINKNIISDTTQNVELEKNNDILNRNISKISDTFKF